MRFHYSFLKRRDVGIPPYTKTFIIKSIRVRAEPFLNYSLFIFYLKIIFKASVPITPGRPRTMYEITVYQFTAIVTPVIIPVRLTAKRAAIPCTAERKKLVAPFSLFTVHHATQTVQITAAAIKNAFIRLPPDRIRIFHRIQSPLPLPA